jgi:hypothetical protein
MNQFPMMVGVLALMDFLFLGAPAGQAFQLQAQADPSVVGMDHSMLNHGVLGFVAYRGEAVRPVNNASDPQVIGTDHSDLGHGVLGAVEEARNGSPDASALVPDVPPLSSWAPPAEIAEKVAADARARLASNEETIKAGMDAASPAPAISFESWAPPAEIADKVAAARARLASNEEAIKAGADSASRATTISFDSGWAPPAEIAEKVAAARRAAATASLRNL